MIYLKTELLGDVNKQASRSQSKNNLAHLEKSHQNSQIDRKCGHTPSHTDKDLLRLALRRSAHI